MKFRLNTLVTTDLSGIYLFLLIFFFSGMTSYGKEEIVDTGQIDQAILWDLGGSKYNAVLEFIKVLPDTPVGKADSLRISFKKKITSTKRNKDTGERQRFHHLQRWTLTVDTLQKCYINRKHKVYVDGVYKRDSLTLDRIEYRVLGSTTLYSYDYRDQYNVPTGQPAKLDYKGHTYFPITESFFNLLREAEAWPFTMYIDNKNTSVEDFYLAGPDRTYITQIDRNKKIIAYVTSDRMKISLMENNKPIDILYFSSDLKSHTTSQYSKEVGNCTLAFSNDEENSPCIAVCKNMIIIDYENRQTKYSVDGSKLLDAINLAKVRSILEDDDTTSGSILDWFLY